MPKVLQWLVLLIFSILFAGALEFGALPAALLIGPMLAAILPSAERSPVAAHGMSGPFGRQLGGGDKVPRVEAAFALQPGARADANDGCVRQA